jgi:hypothetical protein
MKDGQKDSGCVQGFTCDSKFTENDVIFESRSQAHRYQSRQRIDRIDGRYSETSTTYFGKVPVVISFSGSCEPLKQRKF